MTRHTPTNGHLRVALLFLDGALVSDPHPCWAPAQTRGGSCPGRRSTGPPGHVRHRGLAGRGPSHGHAIPELRGTPNSPPVRHHKSEEISVSEMKDLGLRIHQPTLENL